MIAAIIETPWEAIVAVVLILAITYVVHGRPLKVKLGRVVALVGDIAETAEKIDQKASAIDHAVNQRAAGETTVSVDVADTRDRVVRIEQRLAAGDKTFEEIAARLATIEEAVTAPQ